MVARHCECTKRHGIVHVQVAAMVNFVLCEFHLNTNIQLRIHLSPLKLEWLLLVCVALIPRTAHWETSVNQLCRVSQCRHTSLHNTNKSHSLTSLPISSEGHQFFKVSSFSQERLKMYRQQTVGCFHASTMLTPLLSEKTPATPLSLNSHNLLSILSSKNDIS